MFELWIISKSCKIVRCTKCIQAVLFEFVKANDDYYETTIVIHIARLSSQLTMITSNPSTILWTNNNNDRKMLSKINKKNAKGTLNIHIYTRTCYTRKLYTHVHDILIILTKIQILQHKT